MSSILEIRAAIKRTVQQAGLNVYASVSDVVNSPACVIEPHQADYVVAMGMGGDTYEFNLFVLVANKNAEQAQATLDALVTGKGTRSIREFIFRNSSLGLSDVDCIVQGIVPKTYGGNFQVATTHFVGAVLRLCVTIV